jgi:hypothetical protein
VGLGILSLAAALIGTDRWRYGTVTVLLGSVLLGIGAWMNRDYLREVLFFRGPARRGEKRTDPARRAGASRRGASGAQLADVGRRGVEAGSAPAASSAESNERGRGGANRRGARPADREAPIRVASEGVRRADGSSGGDDGPDQAPRLRIR